MWTSVITFTVVAFAIWLGQSGEVVGQLPSVPPLGGEFDDKGADGSYRFGFQTGDRGNHYRVEVASKENQVVGRFGSREPSPKGRVIETQYTAGKRGFRARGPNIARQMDLSQIKIPYNPPVRPDSPNYKPTYSGYHDPNEDPSYKFGFRTSTYSKQETADSLGHVEGVYSFVDDVGERHDVRYEAGSGTGFNVKTAFPDSKPFTGLFYSGPPGKAGGKPRGRSSIQQRLDGSYQFVANAPDHRRAEVSDRLGNVRGSYTFLDDKGQQRTIEYIAGPNIGYKIVRKGVGPGFPPGPSFAPSTSFFPPFSPNFEGVDSNDFPAGGSGRPKPGGSLGGISSGGFGSSATGSPFGSTSSGGFGGVTTEGPSGSFGGSSGGSFGTSTRPTFNPDLGGGFDGNYNGSPGSGSSYPRPPSVSSVGSSGSGSLGVKPGSSSYPSGPDSGNSFGGFRPDSGGIFGIGTTEFAPGLETSTVGTGFEGNNVFAPGTPQDFRPFVTTPTSTIRPPLTSSSPPGYPATGSDYFGPGGSSGSASGSREPPFQGYPSGRPQNGVSLIPGDLPNNCCRSRPSSTSISLSSTMRSPSNYDDIYLQSPSFSRDSPALPPHHFSPTVPPPPPPSDFNSRPYSEFSISYDSSSPTGKSRFREKYNKDDDIYPSSDKRVFRTLGPIRAHVQSLDLLPYGSRIPSPGEAFDRGISYDKHR